MARSAPMPQDTINESRRMGRQLAQYFASSAEPTAVRVPMALHPGEFCVGQVPVTILQWLEGNDSYMHKSGGWMIGGGLLGAAISVASVTTNAVGNAQRRTAAAREAMAQWRPIDEGRMFVTNRRFAVQGSQQWNDIWYGSIRMSDCDSLAILIHLDGWPKTALRMPHADYWFVMFQKLAYNTVMMPPPPTDEAPALPFPTGPAPAGPAPNNPPSGAQRAIEGPNPQ